MTNDELNAMLLAAEALCQKAPTGVTVELGQNRKDNIGWLSLKKAGQDPYSLTLPAQSYDVKGVLNYLNDDS